MRWAEELSKYHFKINYRKESENEKIDALNKRTNYFDEKKRLSETIFNIKKDGIKYNKKYLMTTQKIEKNDALLKKIRKASEKDQIIKK